MRRFIQKLTPCGHSLFRLQPRETHIIKLTKANAKAVKRFLKQNNVHFMADLGKPLFIVRQPDGDKLTLRAGEWLLKRTFLE